MATAARLNERDRLLAMFRSRSAWASSGVAGRVGCPQTAHGAASRPRATTTDEVLSDFIMIFLSPLRARAPVRPARIDRWPGPPNPSGPRFHRGNGVGWEAS